MTVTLLIYYVTPWLRWDRGPHAPDQAVLVDLANRKFFFFAIEIWPQEFYYVAGLLIMAAIGLFLVTSTVGRAWCGYACPQTVWTDLFLVVERWVEGDRNARIRLDAAPFSLAKVRKRLFKYAIWLLIAAATGGAWVFYFADAPSLAAALVRGEAPSIAYSSVAFLTATTFVLAGFMREQVCTFMCPWPRIQAAMLDEDSLVVTYNDWRGEPRSRHRKKLDPSTPVGDCVDCNLCVAVCPQGIDIREGQQLECITCALCIDACDEVMDHVGRPRGLISYSTLRTYKVKTQENVVRLLWQTILRLRTGLYFILWSAVGLTMLYFLLTRSNLDISVLHDRNPLFVQLSDGSIRNGYTLKLLNMQLEPERFTLSIEGIAGGLMTMVGSDSPPSGNIQIDVAPDEVRSVKLYVTAPRSSVAAENTPFRFRATRSAASGDTATYEAKFHAPPL
jgi:cytochrome c oxidase accessory protein FixG